MTVKILRGLPGCGKDTYAETLWEARDMKLSWQLCSADSFFTSERGEYNFVPENIGKAHQTCLLEFIHCAERLGNEHMIIVSNTNIHAWEIAPYVLAGEAYGHDVTIVNVNFSTSVDECFKRGTHGVPREVIARMRRDLVGEELPPFWKQEMAVTNALGTVLSKSDFAH